MATIKPDMTVDKINSYLKKYREITFKSGTYKITAPLTVYSDTNITCKDGVIFERQFDGRMVEFNTAITTTKYNGTHDVTWKGGTFLASTNKTDANVMVLFHCKNIMLKDITFDGCRGLHSLEVNSSIDVKISNCKFKNQSAKPDADFREALQIDFANYDGLKWHGAASTAKCYDGTHCKNVTINNCSFENCPNGIGTHTVCYSPVAYHETIKINDCSFKDITNYGIKILGMKDVSIKNCPSAKILINKKNNGHKTSGEKMDLKDGYRYNSNVTIDNIKIK